MTPSVPKRCLLGRRGTIKLNSIVELHVTLTKEIANKKELLGYWLILKPLPKASEIGKLCRQRENSGQFNNIMEPKVQFRYIPLLNVYVRESQAEVQKLCRNPASDIFKIMENRHKSSTNSPTKSQTEQSIFPSSPSRFKRKMDLENEELEEMKINFPRKSMNLEKVGYYNRLNKKVNKIFEHTQDLNFYSRVNINIIYI